MDVVALYAPNECENLFVDTAAEQAGGRERHPPQLVAREGESGKPDERAEVINALAQADALNRAATGLDRDATRVVHERPSDASDTQGNGGRGVLHG